MRLNRKDDTEAVSADRTAMKRINSLIKRTKSNATGSAESDGNNFDEDDDSREIRAKAPVEKPNTLSKSKLKPAAGTKKSKYNSK